MATVDYCPGTADFKAISERKGAFSDADDISIIGFTDCGGCPGKKSVLRIRNLIARGADTIAFASCITKGTPIGYECPFKDKMLELARKEAGTAVQIIEYTH